MEPAIVRGPMPRFAVKVMHRARPPTPWAWEIYQDGEAEAYRRSEASFRSAEAAWQAGQDALTYLQKTGLRDNPRPDEQSRSTLKS